MKTASLGTSSPDELAAAVAAAGELLREGNPVALPTETVYGLAADALNPAAVLKIFEAKERPFFDPLIVHLPTLDWLGRLTTQRGPAADPLIETFWPGPLTLVLPRRDSVPDLVTSGLETVAVRMSAHPVFQAVIEQFGLPLAAPSANRFGRISPTAAGHVLAELHGRIPLVVDGGATSHGIESTIVALEGETIRVLRSGPITPDQLGQFGIVKIAQPGARPDAPGQLPSHYAPRTPLTLIDVARDCTPAGDCGLLGFTPLPGEDYSRFRCIEWLSATGSLREAASTLFAKLRRLDESGVTGIVAERVPEHGLGIAIMERLRKAAAR